MTDADRVPAQKAEGALTPPPMPRALRAEAAGARFTLILTPEATAPEAVLVGEPAPNPSSDAAQIVVRMPEAGAVRVAVYDVLGREVAVAHDGPLGAGAHAVSLPISALTAGSYVVQVRRGMTVETRRLTVVR